MKWVVTEKSQDYLGTKEFRVVTDNNPLTYVLTSAKLDATSHRWVAALAAYSFDMVYRPVRNNADGDSFSPTGDRSIPKICTSGEMLSHPMVG